MHKLYRRNVERRRTQDEENICERRRYCDYNDHHRRITDQITEDCQKRRYERSREKKREKTR